MTLRNFFCRASCLTGIFPRSELFNSEAYGGWDRGTEREVDIVVDCFLMIRRDFWEALDGFDPAFFMYGEEAGAPVVIEENRPGLPVGQQIARGREAQDVAVERPAHDERIALGEIRAPGHVHLPARVSAQGIAEKTIAARRSDRRCHADPAAERRPAARPRRGGEKARQDRNKNAPHDRDVAGPPAGAIRPHANRRRPQTSAMPPRPPSSIRPAAGGGTGLGTGSMTYFPKSMFSSVTMFSARKSPGTGSPGLG